MIIWLASYPRSGNTFFRVLLNSIFAIKTYSVYDDKFDIGADEKLSNVVGHKFLPDGFAIEQARCSDSVFILKTHDYPTEISADDKVIYLLRDGRESVLSYLNFHNDYMDQPKCLLDIIAGDTQFGGWGEHVMAWEPGTRPNTLLVKFEDLVSNPLEQSERIAEFTGFIPVSNELPTFDELHNTGPRFFRSGKTDSWKKVFSEFEQHAFWLRNYAQMLGHGYETDIPELFCSNPAEADYLSDKELRERLPAEIRENLPQINDARQAGQSQAEALCHQAEALLQKGGIESAEILPSIDREQEIPTPCKRYFESTDGASDPVECETGSTESLVSAGEAAYVAGDIKKAETCFLEAYALDSTDIIACNNLVVLYWESGNTEQALAYLDAAMQLDSTNRDVVVNGGQILSAYGYETDAAGLYEAFLSFSPDDEEVQALYKRALSGGEGGVPADNPGLDSVQSTTDSDDVERIDYSLLENRARAPKISIVVPSFNQGAYLETTIRSVLDQNYPNLELIVMDGGSTDGSVKIIEKYRDRITYWQSQRDEGQYWALNEGFRRSTGEIMAWINSDDKLHVNSLNTMASIFTRRPDVNWVTGTPNIMQEEGFITWICEQTPVFSQNNYLQKKYDFPSFIQQEGTFWRRSLWDQAGATLQTELQMAGDLELWARFFRYSPLHTATVCTGCFRQQKNQKTAKAMTLYRAEAEEVLDREIQRFNQSGRAPIPPVEPIRVNSGGHRSNGSQQLIAGMAALCPVSSSSLTLFSAISPRQKKDGTVKAMHGATMEPLVTAIVSTYNSEKYLRGCLDDLEAQTLVSRLEIIVVDSGSTQSEGAIVREYQQRYTNIRYIRTETRETIYSAWNRAVKEARGKYLTNANTDDRHRSDAYERMVSTLESDGNIALVYADAIVTEQENAAFSDATVTARFSWPDFDARHLFSVCYVGPQPMWRRSLHEHYGYFDPRMRVAGDYDFWLRLASHEKFCHLSEELGLYLSSKNSIEHAFAGVGAQESETARQRNWPEAWGERPPLSQGYLVAVGNEEKSRNQVLPLVSVIMATKNRREMLAYALRSVQDQSYLNWEVILVNDGGEDVSDIVQQLGMEARVRYLQNERSLGQAKARNRAFEAATGDIITILDDDDMYLPHHLRTIVDSLQDGNRYFVYTDAELVQETLRNGKRKEVNRTNPYAHKAWSKKQLHIDNYIPINTWAFRKECLSAVDGFDESLNCCEDWEFLLKLAQQYEFQHICKVTVEVRHRVDIQDNVTRQRLSETEAVYKEIYDRYCAFDGPEVAQGRRRAIERIRDQLNRLADEEGGLLPDAAVSVFPTAVENDDRQLLQLEQKRFLKRAEAESYHCPVVHLITVVDENSLEGLIDTIRSLSDQFYAGWGLTVISGLQSPGGVFDELENLEWITASDQVKMMHEVMQDSIGEWVVPVLAGNRLAPNALSSLVEYSNQRRNWRFIYPDEIAGDWSEQTSTYYKPDFDREYLLNNPYLGQLCFLRKDSLIPGSMQGTDSQTLGFEQALRMTRRYGEDVVGHIPEVLNCRCEKPAETDASGLGREVYSRLLSDYFSDESVEVPVVEGYLPDTFMIDYPLLTGSRVCIVIYAVNNSEVARQTVASIVDKTAFKDYYIRVGIGESDSSVFAAINDDRVQVDIVSDRTSRAEYSNAVGMKPDAGYLLFIEPGIMAIQDVWLSRMLAHGQRNGIAALGVRLISQEQRIMHGGIVTGIGPYGVGCIAFEGGMMSDTGYMNRAQVAQSMGAVSSACMLVRAECFAEVNGFDVDLGVPFYQDVDICQKLQAGKNNIVWTPYVTMLYTGADLASYRGDKSAEYVIAKAEMLGKRWLKSFANDPAYNRNLSLKQAGYSVDRTLLPAWNPDIRDMPRVTGFGAGSRGSWQYRVVQPMKAMHSKGVAYCNQTPFVEKHRVLLPTPVEIERARPDTLLMHNMLHDDCIDRLEQYKKVNKSFVVFGQDDLMFALPPKNPFSKTMYKDVKKRIRRCLTLADRLLVTTDALADGLRGMADDIRVVPNYLDDTIWMNLNSKRHVSSRPRIGWAGAQQHLGDLLLLEEVIRETAGEVDWVFFGMCPDSFRPYVKEVHDGVRFENYHEKLATLNLDLAVAPLEHNRFNEAKSNLRILEYGALGWPVIASDIEPYRNTPVCLVRSQPSAWINAIRDHMHDLDAAYQKGDHLRAWVHEHWMLQDHLTEWLSALDQGSSLSIHKNEQRHATA